MYNTSHCFFEYGLEGSAFAHWQGKNKTTTYWQRLVDGLNDPQFHVFICTVCIRTCGHVIFSQVCAILFMGGPGCRSLSNIPAFVQGDGCPSGASLSRGSGVGGSLWQRPTPDTSTTVPVTHPTGIIFNFVHRHLWRYTLIDRPRHYYLQTLLAWCSWCWTIRCVCSFNYFNMSSV